MLSALTVPFCWSGSHSWPHISSELKELIGKAATDAWNHVTNHFMWSITVKCETVTHDSSTSLTLKPVMCAIALLTPAASPAGPSMNFSSFSLGQWGDSEPIFYLCWTTYRFHMYFWSLPRNWQPWSFWGWCCWHRENRVRLLAQSFLLVLSARSPKCKCFERVGPSL